MLIINDFFKRKKEAVSMQMELIKTATNGKIISATRFMKQKSFDKEDRRDNIYIYPPFLYQLIMTLNLIKGNEDVHIFEEEPNRYKRFLLNLRKRNLYVSMYREPFFEYIEHIKKYKYLKKIFVESPLHKNIMVKHGFDETKIIVSLTPAKIRRKKSSKKYDEKKVNLLFASWNNKEGNPLQERGLIYLLDLLVLNPHLQLTVLLRDDRTKVFKEEIKKRKLIKRVKLVDVLEKDLEKEFDNSDFVVYPIQKKITKDIPNSLIDGLSRGKPIILSTIFGLSKLVTDKEAIIIEPNTKPIKLQISSKIYKNMSDRAFRFSAEYTKEKYVESVLENYE